MQVRCNVQKIIVLSVAVLTAESADRVLMHVLVAVRLGIFDKDCPENRGQAGGNSQPRPNP